MVTVVGDLGMITLIGLSSHLHTPMYYFLSNLSFIDLCQSTVITPKLLVNFVTEKNIISYPECMTQLFFFLLFIIAEGYLLAAMTYEHYVAICSPLLYNITMSHQACFSLICGVYMMGLVCAFSHTGCMLRVHFCKFDVINHYFCDLLPLLKLSCSSTYVNELLVLCFGALNIFAPILTILSSYTFIISSILHIHSMEGRSKALSTYSPHIISVSLFFGSMSLVYLKPSAGCMDERSISSVFYTNVVAIMTPLFYSFRNKDVKTALRKTVSGMQF